MSTPHHPKETASKQFLSPAELGPERWKVSKITLRRWRKGGKLKALKIGRQIRFSIEEIERFEREASI